MTKYFLFLLTFVILHLAATEPLNAQTQKAKTSVTRQGDYTIKQLVSPDFDLLPENRKLYAYYLSLAISAGRDIAWLQGSRHGLEIRTLLELIYQNSDLFMPVEKAGLEDYFFRLLMNHGNYDERKNEKFIPEHFTYKDLMGMAKKAEALLKKNGIEVSLISQTKSLKREIFDKNYRREYLAIPPSDLISDTNSNYYGEGISQSDLEALPEKMRNHFLSYPARINSEKIELQLHRMGGRFHDQLKAIHYYFEKAKEFANEQERIIIEAFQKAIVTGNPEDELEAEKLWVQYKPNDIDFVIGFKEVYNDPLGKRGAWEGFILLKTQNPVTIDRVKNIRANTDYFENQMPVASEFKKEAGFTPPHAEGAYLLYTGGSNGETPFAGVNLPNDPSIREKFGSKSFTALNVMNFIGPKNGSDLELQHKTFFHPRYWESLKQWNDDLASDIQVQFHEILGHGSGKNKKGITDLHLKEYYNPLEEARAEIASLYHILDPKLIGFKIVSTMSLEEFKTFSELEVIDFFTAHLRSYVRLAKSTSQIRQAHQWGRQVMLNWLLADGSLKITLSQAKVPVVEIVDIVKLRNSLGNLWNKIQEAKSTGDYEKAKDIFETWGIYAELHKKWRDELVRTVSELHLPKESVYLNPKFIVTKKKNGTGKSVRLSYHANRGLETFLNAQIKMSDLSKRVLRCTRELKSL